MSKRNISDDVQPLSKKGLCESEPHLTYPSISNPPQVKPVPFQQPTFLLTFSYTPSHELVWNDSAMRHYVDPPPGAELRYGYERWIKRPEERGRIDSLLKAWTRARNMYGGMPGIGVVSWRGVITKILTAPYQERDGWDLNVMYLNGTLYFEEHASEEQIKENENMNPRQRTQTYYGYAFESWCTSSKPDRPESLPNRPFGWGGDVDTNVQWCNVVKTKLGDFRMVIGGEVDCIRERIVGEKKDAFVELKTSLAIRDQRAEARFEKKLLKFYFQSFLLGVPEIIVGFRTPPGRLTTVQSFKTIELPRLVRGKPGAWDPQLCLDWGQRFLSYLKGVIQQTPPKDGQVWRVRFAPGKGVSISVLDGEGVRDVEAGEDRVGFLPRWFWEEETERKKSAGNVEGGTSGQNTRPHASEIRESAPIAGSSRKKLPAGWTI
ncbi:RAI1-domain-containing protein [Neolentinus lepideus HHB14362 ss-1]|uniref:Decapping nuclease n=1 Tax=Neolentinus lepideus HHB14362 ss-1 TaxID=1314782 RepID=A0A165QYY3_9AGAM|nr:RAI1-domain-containing protein [Neolentinus lepideus HHB14362 ss-1]